MTTLQVISNQSIGIPFSRFFSGRGRHLSWLSMFGPALIAAVAYVDSGNFATNIEAGSRYGYTLLWVVLVANLMAMVIQSLSARLGLATGVNLAELIREHFPKPVVWFYWLQAEVVAIATDLAEFLGAALAFKLLFGMSMMSGAFLTGLVTYAALYLQRFGFRLMEMIIGAMVMAIAGGFMFELISSRPDGFSLAKGALIPSFPDGYSVYLAAGILGATIMPHVIYLHSALLQNRVHSVDSSDRCKQMRFYRWDVIVGMALAGIVNMALLAVAAAIFHSNGHEEVVTISEGFQLLSSLSGKDYMSIVFGLGLLLAGLSSSIVGTMSGQVLMQGFVRFTIPVSLRRLLTMAPALMVIMMGVSEQKALVGSQVVLSFGIPFALVPLLRFTASRRLMGSLVNPVWVTVISVLICAVVIGLNGYVLFYSFSGQ
ncbi:Nramp family divalent metal transporter [Gynuella sunshinyii]|uniref:Divalent metal cation transporter MntH n=1 Tax=Gynuella sunshinyii YC6258 TaxID=1445510 RepID=A0A0C5VRB8_9GAMM|nr:Nramp family divalent metal transporter [Gynuella sunshinyii]AJQ95963.1 Mn2+ and Fe2+ transporter of the NRAMP family [Gynuella sunshinyii YC6258]